MSTISGIYTQWLVSSGEVSNEFTIFIIYTNSTIVNISDVEEVSMTSSNNKRPRLPYKVCTLGLMTVDGFQGIK